MATFYISLLSTAILFGLILVGHIKAMNHSGQPPRSIDRHRRHGDSRVHMKAAGFPLRNRNRERAGICGRVSSPLQRRRWKTGSRVLSCFKLTSGSHLEAQVCCYLLTCYLPQREVMSLSTPALFTHRPPQHTSPTWLLHAGMSNVITFLAIFRLNHE